MSDVFIKFCEPAYHYTPFIAEFWNTLSSFTYCLASLHFIFQVNRFRKELPECFPPQLVRRFHFSALAWFILGLGSAAFHAFQTLWAELWDEIGMLLAILSLSYCLFDLHPLTTSHRANWFYGSLVLFMVATLIVYVQIMYHPFFALCFIVSALVPALIAATMPMRINKGVGVKLYQEEPGSTTRSLKAYRKLLTERANALSLFGGIGVDTLVKGGILTALLAYAIWHVDQHCVAQGWTHDSTFAYEYTWYYWSHPLWHCLTAVAVVCFFDAMLKIRLESFISPLMRRIGTGSFIPNFSFASSLRIFFKFNHTS